MCVVWQILFHFQYQVGEPTIYWNAKHKTFCLDDDGDWVFADETTTNWSTGFMAARVGEKWYQTTMPILEFEKYENVTKKLVSKINNDDDDDDDGEEAEEEEDEVEEEEEEEE